MKATKLFLTRTLLFTGLALALLAAANITHATAYTWNGSAGLWSTPTAWNPTVGTTLTSSDDVLLDSSASGNFLNAMGGAAQSVKSITFNSSTPYTNRLYSSTTTTTTARNLVVGTGGFTVSAGDHTILGAKGGSGTTGSLQLGSGTTSIIPFNIASGCSLTFDARLRQVSTPTYTKSGTGTLVLNGDSSGTTSWSFAAAGFTVSEGVLRFTASGAYGTSGNNYSVNSGAALELTGGVSQTANAGTITLNGTGISSAGALRSVSGNNAIAGSGSGGITLATDSSIGVNADMLSITPVISGSSRNLTKVGAGTLTLNGVNTYSGTTTISAGTLALGANGSISNSTSIAIAAGSIFNVSAITAYNLSSSTTIITSGTGTAAGTQATLKGGTTVSFGSQGVTLNWGGDTSGTDTTHPCLVVSQGALTLNNNVITVNGSTLDVGVYTLISVTGGSISGSPAVTPVGTAIDGTKLNVVSVSGGSVILTVSVNTGTTTTTTVTSSSGSSPTTSTYGAALTFKAAVLPASGSDVPTGTVQFKTNSVNYGSPVPVVTDSSPNGKAEIDASTLPYNASAYTITAVYTPSGSFQASSDLTGISQTITQAPVTVSGAAAQSKMFDGTTAATITGTLVGVLPADSANVALSGTGTFASAAVGSGISVTVDSCTLVGSAAGNYSLTPPTGPLSANILDTGIWSNPAGGLWHTAANWTEGTDHVVASGTNNTADFNQVSLSADTTVTLDAPATIGNLIFGNTAVSPAANWNLNSNGVAANKLILAGTNPVVTVNNLGSGKTVTISAVVDGTNGLTKSGSGTLVLDNKANTYTGTTVINQGILQIGNGVSPTSGSIGNNSSVVISNNAVLLINRYYDNLPANVYQYSGKLSGNGTVRSLAGTRFDFSGGVSQTDSTNLSFEVNGNINARTNGFPIIQIGELTGSGSVGRGGQGTSSEITYAVGAKNTDSTFSGTIVNANVQKVGTGKLTLSGANSYGGTTTVSAGTLLVNGSLAAGSAVTVNGGTLGGTGTINGPVNVAGGGTLAPGASVGKLTINSNLTLNATSTNVFEFDVAGLTNDCVTCVDLTPNGSVIALNITGGTLASGTYRLIDYSGTKTGTFGTPVITNGSAANGLRIIETVANQINLLVNHPPVAKAITNGAPAGVTNVIRVIGGKPQFAPTDEDNDSLWVSSVQTPSAVLGATVTTDGTNILYAPGLNASGADTVEYVVSDGFGGFSTNTMYVTVTNQSFNTVSGPSLTNGQFQVTFAGYPNLTYQVDDSTTSASGPWTFYTNLTAGTNGLFQLVVTNDPNVPERYFRTRHQP